MRHAIMPVFAAAYSLSPFFTMRHFSAALIFFHDVFSSLHFRLFSMLVDALLYAVATMLLLPLCLPAFIADCRLLLLAMSLIDSLLLR